MEQNEKLEEALRYINAHSSRRVNSEQLQMRAKFYNDAKNYGTSYAETTHKQGTALTLNEIKQADSINGIISIITTAGLWAKDKKRQQERNKKRTERLLNKQNAPLYKQTSINLQENDENAAETKKSGNFYQISLAYNIGDYVQYGGVVFCVVDFNYKHSSKTVHYVIKKSEKYYSVKASELAPATDQRKTLQDLTAKAAQLNEQIEQLKKQYKL